MFFFRTQALRELRTATESSRKKDELLLTTQLVVASSLRDTAT